MAGSMAPRRTCVEALQHRWTRACQSSGFLERHRCLVTQAPGMPLICEASEVVRRFFVNVYLFCRGKQLNG